MKEKTGRVGNMWGGGRNFFRFFVLFLCVTNLSVRRNWSVMERRNSFFFLSLPSFIFLFHLIYILERSKKELKRKTKRSISRSNWFRVFLSLFYHYILYLCVYKTKLDWNLICCCRFAGAVTSHVSKSGSLTVNCEKVDFDYRLKHNDRLANIVHR